jgi:hypothetical protein
MKRRLFNAGALVSLVLGLAVTVLWVRSYWRADQIVWGTRSGCSIESNTGVVMSYVFLPLRVPVGSLKARSKPPFEGGPHWDQFWRFEAGKDQPLGHDIAFVVVPHWVLVLLAAPLPALWMRSWHNKVGWPCERCPACGYDLRGTPSGPCPECGMARETKAA